MQYAVQSRIKRGSYFWLASVLVFFMIIRRELNYLPDLLISKDFLLLGYGYDWWEDRILAVVYTLIIGLLIYSWHYGLAVLKQTAVILYLSVLVLALLQYMGEHAILLPETLGMIVEELSEDTIYAIALFFLISFKLTEFELQLSNIEVFELEKQ